MVKVLAERELFNYWLIHQAVIPCPAPIFLKAYILLMEFLGKDGWPLPHLKDAVLSEKHIREAYVQTILIMRNMNQR
jgi:RIO kinase 1